MKDLIKQLESATGPERELDMAIAKAVGSLDSYEGHLPYTSSIDAAMTLVDDDWSLSLNFEWRAGCSSLTLAICAAAIKAMEKKNG